MAFCLEALKNQTYKNIEINIVDGFSKDKTLSIAKTFHVREIKKSKGSLLQARYEGTKIARGKYVLILDSDQVLSATTVERAVKKIETESFDMFALEESVYQCNTFIEKLFQLDRQLINKLSDLSPFTGVIMPRFFKTDLLKRAYDNIPMKIILSNTGGPDHAIVYYEAWLISKKVGILTDAIRHMEANTLKQLMRKLYRWGYTSVEAHYGPYHHLMSQKERLRKGLFTKGLYVESLGSILLLFFKGISFYAGYYKGVFDRYRQAKN
ncbi:MAG: glycosyltransferase family 2 protein [Candidatus Parcubacteria bacterium]|nr:glycosyltransferase family 2 protein [Candidatus Parcubacteria bacterium]